jgi:hypothetical protein
MNPAAKVRIEKAEHPERFCSEKNCLWRVVTRGGVKPCRNHPATQPPTQPPRIDLADFVRATFEGAIGDEPMPFPTQDAAALAVEQAISARIDRPLNTSEHLQVVIQVGYEWSMRRYAEQPTAVCGVCHQPFAAGADVTTFRRHSGPTIVAHRECAANDLSAAITIAAAYGQRGLKAVGR